MMKRQTSCQTYVTVLAALQLYGCFNLFFCVNIKLERRFILILPQQVAAPIPLNNWLQEGTEHLYWGSMDRCKQ